MIDILKLLGWIACGYVTARVMYFKFWKDDKSDGGDKVATFLTFLLWPIVLAGAILVGACYLVVQAITWESKSVSTPAAPSRAHIPEGLVHEACQRNPCVCLWNN